MRIIIKPLGLIVLMTALACIAVLPRLYPLKGMKTLTKSANAASGKATSEGGKAIALKHADWELYADPGASIGKQLIDTGDANLKNPMRFDITEPGPNPWCIGYHTRLLVSDFPSGKAQFRFKARAKQNRDILVLTQATVTPFTVDSQQQISLTTEWQEFTVDLPIVKHPEGYCYLTMQFGQSKIGVDIASLELVRK